MHHELRATEPIARSEEKRRCETPVTRQAVTDGPLRPIIVPHTLAKEHGVAIIDKGDVSLMRV